MRILVCGGRDYDDRKKVFEALDTLDNPCALIEGGARGADRLAREWAIDNNVPIFTFNADWETYGRAAGPIRNKQMLVEGKPDIVIAFPGGAGTANMIRQARAAGIPCFTF